MTHVIRVALLPQLLPPEWSGPVRTSVVIDTLRFTTTACQALAAGANSITVARDVEAALQAATRQAAASSPLLVPPQRPLLCGERLCRPIAGFDLGNSPYEYTPAAVAGRELLFTTTNGTVAVTAAKLSPSILLAGLVNRSAVAAALHGATQSTINPSPGNPPTNRIEDWIICSGTDGEVAAEDLLAAGAVIEALRDRQPALVLGNDSAWLALAAWQQFQRVPTSEQTAAVVKVFAEVRGGRNLVENGYARDLEFAARIDALDIVPSSTMQTCDRFTAAQPAGLSASPHD